MKFGYPPEMLRSLVRTLSAAEITSLNTAGLLLLPAPGPGYTIWPLHSVAFLDPGSTVYDATAPIYFSLADTPGLDGAFGTMITADSLNAAAPRVFFNGDISNDWDRGGGTFTTEPWWYYPQYYYNLPLFLVAASKPLLTQGNGTLTLNVFYVVLAHQP